MNQLAKSYAKVYISKIKADIKKYGKEKAMLNWNAYKKELHQVHNDWFISEIGKEFKKIQKNNKS